MSKTKENCKYRIDRRAGKQGSRPSARGQAEVEKYVTGRHYSGVASPGWPKPKRLRTQNNNKFQRNILIGSINTTTMKDPMKLAQCIAECKFLKHSLTFFQETHIFGQKEIPFDNENDKELCGWTFINSGLKSKASAGVGIALSPDVKLIDIDNSILDGRILLVRIILHGIKISAFSAYAPTEKYADSTKDKFFSTLNQAIKKVKREHPEYKVLIGADMNATIGDDSFGDWPHLGPNNDEYPTNDNGTRLLSLSKENDLFIMNSLFPTKSIHRHTWYSPTGDFSKRLDYILAEWHIKKLSTNCRVFRKASIPFETNHRLLTMSCSLPSKRKQKQFFSHNSKPVKPPKNISSLYNDPEVCNNFSKKLDLLLSEDPPCEDVEIIENLITESINQASESETPKITPQAKKSPWANDEFLSLISARRSCKDPSKRKELGKNIRKMRNKLKNDFLIWLMILTLLERRKKLKKNFACAKLIPCTKIRTRTSFLQIN